MFHSAVSMSGMNGTAEHAKLGAIYANNFSKMVPIFDLFSLENLENWGLSRNDFAQETSKFVRNFFRLFQFQIEFSFCLRFRHFSASMSGMGISFEQTATKARRLDRELVMIAFTSNAIQKRGLSKNFDFLTIK